MILVLSQDSWEVTTEEVCDWIESLGGTCVRLNGEDLNGPEPFAMAYDDGGSCMRFRLGARQFTAADIGVVWMRRWHTYENLDPADAAGDPRFARTVREHLADEIRAVTRSLEILLGHAEWLSRLQERRMNKMDALRLATRSGLSIPATLVANDKRALQDFKDRHGRIIAKPIGEGRMFIHKNAAYALYTAEVTQRDIDRAPDRFFPTLVQERLDKAYEIRTFYLDGECHSMAIFSQADQQTETDYRRYNSRRPNRNVPYRLPAPVVERVRTLMQSIPLTTGSLDLVRTRDGRHVFLEVNPVGQFRMVSEPCNYLLERRVAEYLVRKDAHA